MQGISAVTDGDIIAIDGKTLRYSYDKASSKCAIHMINAWSSANGVVLGQEKTANYCYAGASEQPCNKKAAL